MKLLLRRNEMRFVFLWGRALFFACKFVPLGKINDNGKEYGLTYR